MGPCLCILLYSILLRSSGATCSSSETALDFLQHEATMKRHFRFPGREKKNRRGAAGHDVDKLHGLLRPVLPR